MEYGCERKVLNKSNIRVEEKSNNICRENTLYVNNQDDFWHLLLFHSKIYVYLIFFLPKLFVCHFSNKIRPSRMDSDKCQENSSVDA